RVEPRDDVGVGVKSSVFDGFELGDDAGGERVVAREIEHQRPFFWRVHWWILLIGWGQEIVMPEALLRKPFSAPSLGRDVSATALATGLEALGNGRKARGSTGYSLSMHG